MKKAFTLVEILVSLTVITVIIAMFLSALNVKPNSNMVLFRKAYNITSNTVYEMLQSSVYYESGILSNTTAVSQKNEGEYPSGTTKFCKVFASYINTSGTPNCAKTDKKPSFSSLDGLDWYLPPKTTPGTFANKEIIRIDVNGSENLPNCKASSGCKDPDIFDIEISDIGKLYVPSEIARKYLQNRRTITK
jgi:prepilin-type N-terminal cleavage/methylation domain-containing protein